MKRLLYIFCIFSLTACNANKQDKTDASSANGKELPAAAADGALNPVHGAPGHRCEIAVGAPLNSAPTQGSAPLSPQPTQQMPATPATNGAGAKLNPEHGLPGHDCKLPVGAPLT